MKTLLAIPCYNCEIQIARVMESIKNTELPGVDEIILINNKSTDSTLKVIQSFGPPQSEIPTSIINNSTNYGLGGSFKLMHQYALDNGFSNLGFFHGDDQACISDFFKMNELLKTDAQMTAVLGARFHPKSIRTGYSRIRTYGNIALNLIFSLFCFKKILDIGSGLNIYNVKALDSLDVQKWPNHIAFDVNILLGLIRKRQKIEFFPIRWTEEDQVSNAKNLSTGIVVILMLFKWVLRFKNSNEKWKMKFIYDKIVL